jgi:hypothetical protein
MCFLILWNPSFPAPVLPHFLFPALDVGPTETNLNTISTKNAAVRALLSFLEVPSFRPSFLPPVLVSSCLVETYTNMTVSFKETNPRSLSF